MGTQNCYIQTPKLTMKMGHSYPTVVQKNYPLILYHLKYSDVGSREEGPLNPFQYSKLNVIYKCLIILYFLKCCWREVHLDCPSQLSALNFYLRVCPVYGNKRLALGVKQLDFDTTRRSLPQISLHRSQHMSRHDCRSWRHNRHVWRAPDDFCLLKARTWPQNNCDVTA